MKKLIRLLKFFLMVNILLISGTHTIAFSDNSILNGTYIANQFIDDEVDSGGYSIVSRMEITFNGAGSGSYKMLANSTGHTSDSGSFTYNVASDGTVTTNFGDVGIVSSDGNVFTISETDASDDAVYIMVGIRKGSGLSNATLKGTYIVNQFMDDEVDSGGWSLTSRLELTFDGSGKGSFKELSSSTGHGGGTGSFTYNVASDGTVTTNFGDVGIVSSDGNVFTISDTNASDDAVHIMVGIRKGSGLSNSTLEGTYIANQFMDDEVDSGGYSVVSRYEITFNGAGSGSYKMLASSTGHTSNSGSFTYNVASDGTWTTSKGDGGIVSSDGNVFTISETDPSDDAVHIMVGIKKWGDQPQRTELTSFPGVLMLLLQDEE